MARLLAERIKRKEEGSADIIEVPFLSVEDRKLYMQEFAKTISDKSLLEIINRRIKNQDGTNKFDAYFGDEADNVTKENWGAFKRKVLSKKVDEFLAIHKIEPEGSTILYPGDTLTITI